jgi:hypothetical protein
MARRPLYHPFTVTADEGENLREALLPAAPHGARS